jgi:uncharacterized protein YndB with AHSA1/START domain
VRDLIAELAKTHRAVARDSSDLGEIVRVTMRRTYATDPADLWEALTDPERIRRWFMPISGELKEGGSYQLEGNAGGEILECSRPSRLRTTFGSPESIVQLTLAARGAETTELTLDHSVPLAMASSVAGALFVGPGWDGAFLGLALYVAGEAHGDPREAANLPETIAFSRASIERWTEVVRAAGATPEETEGVRRTALAQFDPQGAAG